AHAERIAADTRPAAFVEDAKPIISEPGKLPRLRQFMGMPDVRAASANINPAVATNPRSNGRPTGRFDVTPAAYTPATDDILIADFEGEDYGDWTTAGTAFGDRPARVGTHRNKATGYLGKGLANSYLNGDQTTGTLTSPPVTITGKYLNFLIGGGHHPGKTGLHLVIDGKTVRAATGRALKNSTNHEIMDWRSWDVSELAGKKATLEIVDHHDGGWGHTVVDHIFQSNRPMPPSLPAALQKAAARPAPTIRAPSPLEPGEMDPAHRTFASYGDVGYDQKLRPQFHFTSRKNWINDPNGMVYHDGEWHLYFQHCALGVNRGPKSWGHAVSTDMVHWEQLPHAILPYDKGAIWSGTAVVDHDNSLGRQVGDTKTLVAFFTTTWKDGFFQAMAYSTDRGRTYTLHNKGEPVVGNQGVMRGERDPKVFWDEARNRWKMILILGGKERIIRIFESENLVDWAKAGDIRRNWAAECIDLFQLPVDGDGNNMKWVIADASFDYEIGHFDGTSFVTDGETMRGDFGRGFYAAQTFNNGPDGRVVQIGWMNDRRQECPFLVQGMPFNQQMAFPTDLTLRTTSEGIRLFRWPVPEIKSLYQKTHALSDLTVETANRALSELKPELVDLSVEFAPGDDGVVDLTVRGVKITYGNLMKLRTSTGVREVKCFSFNGKSCPAPLIDGRVKLRVLADRASLELYANEGATVACAYEFEIPRDYSLSISANKEVWITSLVVNELKSAWPEE
ncbi:MAG: glycoside hydrolase family 32 protein, partial [Planctomycetes bacterium]|nr:glycoside hydrolase family 32 protein [Planctomycetota bacterium]